MAGCTTGILAYTVDHARRDIYYSNVHDYNSIYWNACGCTIGSPGRTLVLPPKRRQGDESNRICLFICKNILKNTP
jgi:hypothetical protein